MKYCLLLPAETSVVCGSALNVLLVVQTKNETSYIFRFWGNDGSGWKEVWSQKKTDLAPRSHVHLYFTLPSSCFEKGIWQTQPEELELRAGDDPQSAVCAPLIEVLPART